MTGSSPRRAARGFTLIELLVVMLIIGTLLSIAVPRYFRTLAHARETVLRQDLVQDERFPVPKHHLRRLYPDPVTGKADWSLIPTPSGQAIMGVASSSQGVPIKRDGFDTIDEALKGADCYCAWKFVYYANRWNRGVGTGATNPGATNPPGPPGTIQPGNPGTLRPAPQPGYGAPGTIQPGDPGTNPSLN